MSPSAKSLVSDSSRSFPEIPQPVRAIMVATLIYAFLVGVSSLEAGINLLGADTQERLFSNVSHPMAGLFVGLLGTVLVQSSSASTSLIVGLVASGAVSIDAAVPMVMGANIGTSVTNTLVSLGHVRHSDEFRRAFAAATVHDFFNLLAVSILLPFELATGALTKIAESITEVLVGTGGSDWESPIKKWVKEPVGWIQDGLDTLGAHNNVLAGLMVLSGLLVIISALTFITVNMKQLVAERVERSMNAILGRGGGIMAILVGVVITVAVQSSSITTSILVPMSAAGVITLRNAYPVTLGANIGTTITALLAAMATSSPAALTVALVHTTFNVVGVTLLYGIPIFRLLPIVAAERLAEVAVVRRTAALAYVLVAFILVPIIGVLVFR